MTTIVMNTMNGAVTEYDWAFQSLTPANAGSASGLFVLGGNTDATTPITGQFLSGDHGGEHKLGLGSVYVGVQGEGAGEVLVKGAADDWAYPVTVRASGISRAKAGRGISENYLALGYRNVDGADFTIDRIDAEVIESKQRRL
jgi:hypothetical protein